jgi:hypothetical protein
MAHDCSCHLWTSWIDQASPAQVKHVSTFLCIDGTQITHSTSERTFCSYWKQSYPGQYNYANGTVRKIVDIHHLNNPTTHIVAIDTNLDWPGVHFLGEFDLSGPRPHPAAIPINEARAYQKIRAALDPNKP